MRKHTSIKPMAFDQREHARNLKIKYLDASEDYQKARAACETFKAKMRATYPDGIELSHFDRQMLGVSIQHRDNLAAYADRCHAEWRAADIRAL